MTKNLKIGFLVSMVLFSLILTSSFAPVACAQEDAFQEETLSFLSDVLEIKTEQYTTSKRTQQNVDHLGNLQLETSEYFTSAEGSFRLTCNYVKDTLQLVYFSELEGSLAVKQRESNTVEMAKRLLERYQISTHNSFYGEIASMLENIDVPTEATKYGENVKLEVKGSEQNLVTYMWTYVDENGILAERKNIILVYEQGLFKGFFNNWPLYTIVNTSAISKEKANAIAIESSKDYSYQVITENGTEMTVSGLTISPESFGYAQLVYLNSIDQEYARGGDPFKLYPVWNIPLGLDKFYPGDVSGITVILWADTGDVCSMNRVITDTTGFLPADVKETEPKEEVIQIAQQSTEIPLILIIVALFGSISLLNIRRAKLNCKNFGSKSWSILLCMAIISTVVFPTTIVNAVSLTGRSRIYASVDCVGTNNGYRNPEADLAEKIATAEVCNYIGNASSIDAGYITSNLYGSTGTGTIASDVISQAGSDEQNYLKTMVFYAGHFADSNTAIQDNNGVSITSDAILSQTSLGRHFFTYLWVCLQAQDHSSGMPVAWTHRDGSLGHEFMGTGDFEDPDNDTSGQCYISFQGFSPMLSNMYQNYTKSIFSSYNVTGNDIGPCKEFLKLFYNYTLIQHYTVHAALDFASADYFGCSYYTCPLSDNEGYNSWWPGGEAWNFTDPESGIDFSPLCEQGYYPEHYPATITGGATHNYMKIFGNADIFLYQPCLNISGVYGGYTDPAAGEHYYGYGSNVSVTATSNVTGGYFVHWLLDDEPVWGDTINITMTEDHTLEPIFYTPPVSYSLQYAGLSNLGSTVAADVYLDGEYQGHFSSHTFYVAPGPHTVEVSTPNGYSFQNFTDSNDQTHYNNPTTIYVWADSTWIHANFISTLSQSTIIAEDVSDGHATSYPMQRKTFYANGRFWAFFEDDGRFKQSSSVDGTTWTNPTHVRYVSAGYYASLCFDGTYVHIVWKSPGSVVSNPPPSLNYQRGTPNTNGTITWSSPQTVAYQQLVDYLYPTIAVDSDGYPWIGYHRADYLNYASAYVTKSSTNDGTWSTATGFPYQLAPGPYDQYCVVPVALTEGKMLALFGDNSGTIYARRWDGSSWASQTSISTGYVGRFSAVSQGDNVQLVFSTGYPYSTKTMKYNYSSNSFGSIITLHSDDSNVVISKTDSDDLYAFWIENYGVNVYYKKYTNSTGLWDATATDWIYDPYLWSYYDTLTCSYQNELGKISIEYVSSNAEAENNVMFNYLDVPITTFSVYNLTIMDVPGGTTNPLPDTYTYMPDANVQVTAIPNVGFILDHWLLDDTNVGNNITITVNMNNSHTLEPVFTALGIGRVQGNARGIVSGFTPQIPVTLDYTPTEGNVLVAVIGGMAQNYAKQSILNITQTGVTWTRQVNGSYYNIISEIWLGVVGPGASKTLTVNLQNPTGAYNVYSIADVCEYTGIATSNPRDRRATEHGSSAAYLYTGTTSTTTQANELWIGGIYSRFNYDQDSPSNGFTLLDGITIDGSVAYLEKIVTSTGTAGTSTIAAGGPSFYYGCIATFKAAP